MVFVLPRNTAPNSFRHVSSAVYFSLIFRFLVHPPPHRRRRIDDNYDTIDTPSSRCHRRCLEEMWQIAPVWQPFVSFGPVPISQTQIRLFFATVGGIYKFFKYLSHRSARSRRSVVFRRSRWLWYSYNTVVRCRNNVSDPAQSVVLWIESKSVLTHNTRMHCTPDTYTILLYYTDTTNQPCQGRG